MKPGEWRPSNGTEMEMFLSHYCMSCERETFIRGGERRCRILSAMYLHDLNDGGWPAEIVEHPEHQFQGHCTAYVQLGSRVRNKDAEKHRALERAGQMTMIGGQSDD